MNVVQLADGLSEEVNVAIGNWYEARPPRTDGPLISMPCAKADLLAVKLREASTLLAECASLISALHEAAGPDHDSRLTGRVRLASVRMAEFQTINPHHSIVIPVRAQPDVKIEDDPEVPGRTNVTMTIPRPSLTSEQRAYIDARMKEAIGEVAREVLDTKLAGLEALLVTREVRPPLTEADAIAICRRIVGEKFTPSEWMIRALQEAHK